MEKKLILVGLMGMNKDVINSKTAQLQAYEIKNFRLSATLDSNAFELTTERGTKSILLCWKKDKDTIVRVEGTIIGYCILNNYLVLFTVLKIFIQGAYRNIDRIYRLTLSSNEFNEYVTEIVPLYYGFKLNFSTDNLIDSIPYYETELIQKVYWIDGINQPRVINIANMEDSNLPKQYINANINYDPYGFVLEIYSDYNPILVTKGYVGGMFHAGVIQYAYSFFNENAQETPVIDVTPLYYIAHEDRGEKPDTRVGCTFTLSLEIPKDFLKKFDYVRFYSIYRSSLDTTPLVKVINEIEINNPKANTPWTYTFTDDNTLGYVYDALLLLIRNNKIIPQTFNYKDGKLFFGNFKNEIIIDALNNFDFTNINTIWELKEKSIKIQEESLYDVYNFENQLNNNSEQIKTFKALEKYHLGVLFLDKYGNWTQPYYIRTTRNPYYPKGIGTNNGHIYHSYNVSTVKTIQSIEDIIRNINNTIDTSDYIRIRPVVSFPTASERTILCQGIVNPTVFNLELRINGTCYTLSSWFFRPYPNTRLLNGDSGLISWLNGLAHILWLHNRPIFNSDKLSGELLNMYSASTEAPAAFDVPISSYDTEETYPSGDYQGLTEYEAKQLKLIYGGGTVLYQFGGRNYYHYYNVGTYEEPLHTPYGSASPNYYADFNKEVITDSNDSSLTGLKYTVYLISDDPDDVLETRVYFVSTCGQSWTYTENSTIASDYRQDISAHLIPESKKDLYNSYYYVDTLVCTLNSPDLEFDTNILNTDINNYGLLLTGSSRFVNCVGKYNIIAQSPLFINDVDVDSSPDSQDFIRSTNIADGFSINRFSIKSDETTEWQSNGSCIISALNCWYDDACNLFTWDNKVTQWNSDSLLNSYVVYPWQRKYLNNFNNNQNLILQPNYNENLGITTETGEPSLIIKKILANLRFCYTDYFRNDSYLLEDIEYLKLFNSEETTLLKLTLDTFYNGNIDLLITCVSNYYGYECLYKNNENDEPTWTKSSLSGYPLILGRCGTKADATRFQGKNYGRYIYRYFGLKGEGFTYGKHTTPNNRSTDPIWIRYKSSPHFVFKLSNGRVLPELGNIETPETEHLYNTVWGESIQINTPQIINKEYHTTGSTDLSYLFVADIYNPEALQDNSALSDFELLNRVWLPCGESLPLNSDKKLVWSEGDTFFQRYDCLKTYPFSNDDYQSVVEIGSFMLETRVNLDGRYDTNRGLMDNTAVTKENFNLINPVYSQMNNFFLYKMLDDRFNNKETEYKNRITWTLDKQNGDDVDLWTRVTELGILDLDGDKGKVTKIERFDNNLYIFQDKGVARLNYNDNIQIPTEGNIPIEVVNSGFINGKRYISENQGLQDKWCSKSTPYGIFFKDGYSKALHILKYDERRNPIIGPLSYGSMLKWTELNIDDIYMVNYDNQVNEVLFMLKNEYEEYYSLNYSPLYQAFTAFYDYKGWITNYNNSTISILKDDNYYSNTLPIDVQFLPLNIYFVRRHEYSNEPAFNCFYDEIKPYWIKWTSVVDNYDCIFNNIYYKGDLFNKEENNMNDNDIITEYTYSNPVFDEISVSNDYQSYELEEDNEWKEFNPRKKFRVWRGAIPRLTINGKYMASRIRNHWVRIGLKGNEKDPNEYKAIVKDLKVEAFF